MHKTIKTHVVGIQYCDLDAWLIGDLRKQKPLVLIREPSNVHDSNAVAVLLNGRKIGFIRSEHAKVLSPAMSSGLSNITITINTPQEISAGVKSFSVTIILQSKTDMPVHAPKVVTGVGIGIYRIRLTPSMKTYIGQTNNLNARLARHWKDLSLGVHANKHLQLHWNLSGPQGFMTELVEKAPANLSPYERQSWLGRKEYHWIELERDAGHSVNILDGEIVLTPSAVADREAVIGGRIKAYDLGVKTRKAAIVVELANVIEASRPHECQICDYEEQVRQIELQLKNHTGLRSLFKGRISRSETDALRRALTKVSQALATAQAVRDKYQRQRRALENEKRDLKTIKQRVGSVNHHFGKYGIHIQPSDFLE